MQHTYEDARSAQSSDLDEQAAEPTQPLQQGEAESLHGQRIDTASDAPFAAAQYTEIDVSAPASPKQASTSGQLGDEAEEPASPEPPSHTLSSSLSSNVAPVSPFATSADHEDDSQDDSPRQVQQILANGRRNSRVTWEDQQLGASQHFPPLIGSWGEPASRANSADASGEAGGSSDSDVGDASQQQQQLWSDSSAEGQPDAPERMMSFPSIEYEPADDPQPSDEPPPTPRHRSLSSIPAPATLAPPADRANGINKYIQDQHRQTLPEQRMMHDPSALMDAQPARPLSRQQPSPAKLPSTSKRPRPDAALRRLGRESAPAAPRRWHERRSIDLQPAPTEDVNGMLDEAVRELVSERAPPGLLGMRSLSDSNLSKRSSGQNGGDGTSGDGSGDHRASLPVDVEVCAGHLQALAPSTAPCMSALKRSMPGVTLRLASKAGDLFHMQAGSMAAPARV